LSYPELLERSFGVFEIIWINVILSGDNALVIALACRGLPPERRRIGMVLGAGIAVVMRIALTAVLTALMTTPFVKIVGGVLLLWVGAKLTVEEEEAAEGTPASDRLWAAVRTVAVADAVMSLDNVLAIAAVANGSTLLLVLGLGISVPLIVAGASLVMALLQRFPALVWAGAVLLGYLAGEMIMTDPFLVDRLGSVRAHSLTIPAEVVGAALVLLGALFLRHRHGGDAGRPA
jgi:YjbE family integral membrane protein